MSTYLSLHGTGVRAGTTFAAYLTLIFALIQTQIYGTVIAGGLAISKNLSLEGAPFQAFVMERVLIVSDF